MRVSRTPGFATIAAICGLLISPAPIIAQARYDFPGGRVEVLGLRRWTLSMLEDSVRQYAPGKALHDAACMIILREQLHFAEASVTTIRNSPPGAPPRSFLSITLIEPEDGARVVWDTVPRDEFTSLLPDYAPLVLAVTNPAGGVLRGRLWPGLSSYLADSASRVRRFASAPPAARQDAERSWAFLDARRSEADRQRAMKVLQTDGFFANRMVAIAVLSNFAAHDSTWWTLARALRDPHEAPRGMAEIVLSALPRRSIDWTPAANDLRLLLGGTNLRAMPGVFDLLSESKVDPRLAASLLRGNGDWVLDHLASEAPMAGPAARRMLVQLNNGVDLGTTRSAWQAWIAAL